MDLIYEVSPALLALGVIGLYLATQVVAWLLSYFYRLWAMRAIPGPKGSLFLGNLSYFSSKRARE